MRPFSLPSVPSLVTVSAVSVGDDLERLAAGVEQRVAGIVDDGAVGRQAEMAGAGEARAGCVCTVK